MNLNQKIIISQGPMAKFLNMKDIHQLIKEVDALKLDDNNAYLEFYENNIESIEKIDPTHDREHFNAKLRFTKVYGISLVGVKQYSRGMLVLKDVISTYEKLAREENSNLKDWPSFENILWNYGLALQLLDEDKQSYSVFKRLAKYYPESKTYKVWLKSLRLILLRKYVSTLTIVVVIWVLSELTIFKNFDSKLKDNLSLIGDLLLGVWCVLTLYIYWLKRENTKAQKSS